MKSKFEIIIEHLKKGEQPHANLLKNSDEGFKKEK